MYTVHALTLLGVAGEWAASRIVALVKLPQQVMMKAPFRLYSLTYFSKEVNNSWPGSSLKG